MASGRLLKRITGKHATKMCEAATRLITVSGVVGLTNPVWDREEMGHLNVLELHYEHNEESWD